MGRSPHPLLFIDAGEVMASLSQGGLYFSFRHGGVEKFEEVIVPFADHGDHVLPPEILLPVPHQGVPYLDHGQLLGVGETQQLLSRISLLVLFHEPVHVGDDHDEGGTAPVAVFGDPLHLMALGATDLRQFFGLLGAIFQVSPGPGLVLYPIPEGIGRDEERRPHGD